MTFEMQREIVSIHKTEHTVKLIQNYKYITIIKISDISKNMIQNESICILI